MASKTNPDECFSLYDIMYDRNHEKLFLLFEPIDGIDEQVEHWVREYLCIPAHVITIVVLIWQFYIT